MFSRLVRRRGIRHRWFSSCLRADPRPGRPLLPTACSREPFRALSGLFCDRERRQSVTDVLAAEETTLVARFRLGDPLAARTIMQRHNRRLWRLARGIVDDDTEAEEALHNAYVRALTSICTFRGESSLATWLARIVVNE